MDIEVIKNIISYSQISVKERKIADKLLNNERISFDEGVFLYKEANMDFLSLMATFVKNKFSSDKIFFNKNIHIEPSNICIYNCKFCSFKRRFNAPDAWDYSIEQIIDIVKKYQNTNITEIHITGGVHPHYNLFNYCTLLRKIKELMPHIHIKAFTAVEIDYMCQKSNLSYKEGLEKLKEAGLDSLPGGGAEIFNQEIRKQICFEKSSSKLWLEIHKTAHLLGIPSNATMLYGHIENYEHRIEHLDKLRQLQDQTKGFNAFIPLKFKNINNKLSDIKEIPLIEDMRNFAVSRIYLDNISHLKFYWVNFGKKYAQLSLNYGVDDLDGTIDDSTKIYSMAGAEEKNPKISESEMIDLINETNNTAVERNSVYKELKIYKK